MYLTKQIMYDYLKGENKMAILERDVKAKMTIDLSSPMGNAWGILGLANRLGRELGIPENKLEELQEEMKSGDYENLIQVFDREFGDYVDLIR